VRRILLSLLLTLLLIVTLTTHPFAYAGRVVDPKTEQLGLLLTENMELSSMTSVLYGRSTRSDVDWRICKSITDSVCTAATQIMIIQFFALCEKLEDVNCIEEVWARGPDGTKISGIYQRHLPVSGNTDFPAEPTMQLPASKGNSFVMKLPSAIHLGKSDDYLVSLRNMTQIEKGAGESATNYRLDVQGLIGGITPFELLTGAYRPITVGEGYSSDGGLRVTPSGDTCFASDTGVCAAIRPFPKDYRYGLSIRLSQRLSGWFHGRITAPLITTSLNGEVYRASIEASPVKVASLDFLTPTQSLSQEIKDIIFNGEEWGVSGNLEGVRITTGLEEDRAQTLLRLFTPHFQDKATRTNQYWTIKTLGDFRNDSVRRCTNSSGDLAGAVSTNALLYSAGPPTFNQEESSLDYKVAAPHYESDGSEASGTYDLLLRSDVARCIYGFTNAPIKATLEVLSNDGSTKVASTTISERNGWLVMSAAGFGFSSPIVRARLSQDPPTPSPSASPTATPLATPMPTVAPVVVAKPLKKTITCVKGSASKKVRASKPKCPTGWKKA
jgi:hypothetical protein